MSKYIQVNQALAAIEQGRFQILCNDFLRSEYSGDLQSTGTVEGKEKSRKGQPDAYLRMSTGQYILGEFTTKDDSNKQAFENKLLADLQECLKFDSLGIKAHQVDQVVLCCNSAVDLAFEEKLHHIVSPLNIRLRIVGIHTLSTYYSSTGKVFARDFLNIPFDTGQILSKAEFLSRYGLKNLATPLTNPLFGREMDLKKVLSMVENRAISVLCGSPGNGKTRLALQVMDDFVMANPEYTPYYIFLRTGDIIEDLVTFLIPGKKYILLIDDANRQLTNLLSVLDRLLDHDIKLKIMLTVRDYAKEDIIKYVRKLDFEFYYLQKLNDESIQRMISSEPYQIRDWSVSRRICEIAEGNPRLAMMTARVYTQNPVVHSISDISAVYDEYFQSIMDDGFSLTDELSVKVLGILSFFNSIDINSELDLPILTMFGITVEDFYSTAERLEHVEVVEIYQHTVVKITEQILSTYMFYQAFIAREVLNLRLLLHKYLERNRSRFMDTIIPVISVFGVEKVIGKHRKMFLEVFDEIQEDTQTASVFLELFGAYFPEQLFLYVSRQIKDTKEIKPSDQQALWEAMRFSGKSTLLNLLSPFYSKDSNNFLTALALGFLYIEKRPDRQDEYVEQLKNSLYPDGEEVSNGFPRLRKFSEWLADTQHLNDYRRNAFYQVFKHCFLNTHYEPQFYITIENGHQLHPNFAVMRTLLWERIIKEYLGHPRLIEPVLQKYVQDKAHLNMVLLHFDEAFVMRFISANMQPAVFGHCYFVQEFLRLLSATYGRLPEQYKSLNGTYMNRTYEIFQLLSYQNYRGIYNHDKIEEARSSSIAKHLPVHSLTAFEEIYRHITTITNYSIESANAISDGLSVILSEALKIDLEVGLSALTFYMKEPNDVWINVNRIFGTLFYHYPEAATRVYELVLNATFKHRQNWLENFFYTMPEKIVNASWSEKMLLCYHHVASSNLAIFPDHFMRYEKVREDTIYELLHIYYSKREADQEFIYKLEYEFFQKLPQLVAKHPAFCEALYFHQDLMEAQYDLRTDELFYLIDNDITFFNRYIDHLTSRQERTFNGSRKTLTRIWFYQEQLIWFTGLLSKCGIWNIGVRLTCCQLYSFSMCPKNSCPWLQKYWIAWC
ncbi:hypothetical protein ABDD95_07705 [Mucilaginibacter sp. PAMB04274]|uniref:hypothetical protein n=1 Tax=Mucilaginibacter sp. PAMB04274 TaxID=3138568 RepID=UPI0031F6FA9B